MGERPVEVVRQVVGLPGRLHGLPRIWLDPQRGVYHGGVVTLGARGDSFYEYLLKQWLLTGKQDAFLLR